MYEPILDGMQPDEAQRRCYDCTHCRGATSWWCRNEEAVKYRGTAIPGVRDCTFWKGCRTVKELTWWERHNPLSFLQFVFLRP